MEMLKKATRGVLTIWLCSHGLYVGSARQAYSAEVSYEGREWLRPCCMILLTIPGRAGYLD